MFICCLITTSNIWYYINSWQLIFAVVLWLVWSVMTITWPSASCAVASLSLYSLSWACSCLCRWITWCNHLWYYNIKCYSSSWRWTFLVWYIQLHDWLYIIFYHLRETTLLMFSMSIMKVQIQTLRSRFQYSFAISPVTEINNRN